jgi:hypothetical protein
MYNMLQKFSAPNYSDLRKTTREILRSRGLSDIEINNYDVTFDGILHTLFTLEEKIIDAIIIRFILTLFKKYDYLSELAETIMYSIFMDVARFRLVIIIGYYRDYIQLLSDEHIPFEYYMDKLIDDLDNDSNYRFPHLQ